MRGKEIEQERVTVMAEYFAGLHVIGGANAGPPA